MLEIVLFVIFPLLSIAVFIVGTNIYKNKILWAFLPLIMILFLYLFYKFPGIEYTLISGYYYGVLKYFIPLLPLLFLFGLAANFRPQRWRQVIYFALAGAGLVFYLQVQIKIWMFDYKSLKGKINEKGYCIQSTSYTCGPAAAVTLLNLFAMKTSEAKVSQICRTFPATGTNEFVLQHTLNLYCQKSNKQNLSFKLKSITLETISPKDVPFLAMIRLKGSIAHWIIVKKIKGQNLEVFDPLMGNVKRKKLDYKDVWLHRCIVPKRK